MKAKIQMNNVPHFKETIIALGNNGQLRMGLVSYSGPVTPRHYDIAIKLLTLERSFVVEDEQEAKALAKAAQSTLADAKAHGITITGDVK